MFSWKKIASNEISALGKFLAIRKILALGFFVMAAWLSVSCKPGKGGAAMILTPVK